MNAMISPRQRMQENMSQRSVFVFIMRCHETGRARCHECSLVPALDEFLPRLKSIMPL